MLIFWIMLGILLVLGIACLLTAYICFYRIFYSPKRKGTEEYPMPDGKIYEVYREDMIRWIQNARTLAHRRVEIRSFDGLMLRGRYYEYEKGAPIEILFHGYRGSALQDLSGGIARCFALGHSALVVDHRASGESEGRVITFGIHERRDCLSWIDFVCRELDPDAKIILTGISMGAATVMMAAAEDLPQNVVGVLADCGYTSAEEIIKKVITEMKMPADLLYPFVKLGGRLFGGFDIDETSPVEAMAKSRVPVIFFHGDDDDFVPSRMSLANYQAGTEQKRIVFIGGAGHGLAFPANKEAYIYELRRFFEPILEGETLSLGAASIITYQTK